VLTGTQSISWLPNVGVGNDVLSSLRVAPGYMVTIYSNGAYDGATRTFAAGTSVRCLSDNGFDNVASSLKIEVDPSKSHVPTRA
jgi:hypothetical protein